MSIAPEPPRSWIPNPAKPQCEGPVVRHTDGRYECHGTCDGPIEDTLTGCHFPWVVKDCTTAAGRGLALDFACADCAH